MSKKISVGVVIGLMAIVAAFTFTLTMMFAMNRFNDMVNNLGERENMYDQISEIDAEVREDFIGTIDEKYLNDMLATGYIRGLNDAYSRYITAEEYESFLVERSGYEIGIGLSWQKDETNGYLTVMSVIPETPAAIEGITNGDLIVAISESDTALMTETEARKLMSGEAGSALTITYRRDGEDKTITLTRRAMPNSYVEYRTMGELSENGYIKITSFNEAAYEQFEDAVAALQSSGVSGIVIDIRDTTGGSFEIAAAFADLLLPEGALLYATDKNGITETLYSSDPNLTNLPITVIIDKETQGPAELFAASMRDFNYGSLIGETTYGKGVMQEVVALSDGSAIEYSVAVVAPASGVTFNGVGVAPDYEVILTAEEEGRFELLDETNDPQLIRAIEILNSLKLIG